ncbi:MULTISPECIES: replication factor C small subunit [Pyrobaculum]|uniref:Replication factor C small subunit 1 n=5 Tax=Pyrobaculum TaxID=2276 RepID=RFCS1_PYRAR|nr:replication factor C small subunit [Pyrobaculum arsenaticum]A4WGV2.1 RecName: Full=Replication factor C small subunit 1; Short=RFC small subunit 1; AltName: Full=Clamp loader small subunit 1 [Pyrobaculum arsenaticum DSM 13514]ABP49619.1 Replication factor C [Pyrobaculum arsenaticum DSM 13514]NYR15606.1 replication factor C small subunit [Pyrobaculum arsenaticum]
MAELFWFEKYRPRSFDEVVDLEEVKARLREFVRGGNMPHLLFYGPPGTGKTTMALVLARELYGEYWRENTLELNASDERGINVIRERVKEFARTAPVGKAPFKLVILDEADNMTSDAQQALRRIMEMYAQNTRFILLANYVSRIIDPIISRCAVFRFSPMPRSLMAERLRHIAKSEGIELRDDAIDLIYEVSEGDMRKAINLLQVAAATSKVVDANAVASATTMIRPADVVELFNLAFNGDVTKAREKLRELMYVKGIAGIDFIRAFQRELIRMPLDDEVKAEIAELLAEVDYRLTQGSDEELQLLYLLSKLGAIGKRARQTPPPSKRR